jgi:VWFA-related protein
MKRFGIAGAFVLSAVASLAQQTIGESIEVRVVNIDVVVHDRAGKPVTGLTRDDFEIYENGRKQEITNLYEVRAPAALARHERPAASGTSAPPPSTPASTESSIEVRPRSIVMFVDNYSLDPFRRDKVLRSLRKFVDEKLSPQDQVMLVLCTQQVKVITPFTTDRNVIHQGIASIADMGRSGPSRQQSVDKIKQSVSQFIDAGKERRLPMIDYYKMSLGLVENYVEEVIFSSRNTLAALGQTTAAISGVEGKKVLIFAGAHLPERPGIEMYQWLTNAFSPYLGSTTFSTDSILGKTGSMQHYSIEEAAKQSSINGVTLYMIDAADSRDMVSAESSLGTDTTEQFTNFTNTAMAYQTLARISGGLALTNTENFDVAFQTLATDLDSYYSLGFKPSNTTNTGRRSLAVKAKNPQYSIRTRETYATKSTEDEMSARVIANIYTSDARGAWQVELKPGTPEKEGVQYRVPFEISFAPTITLLPQQSDLVGSFTVYIVVGSGGRTSKVIKSLHPVKIPSEVESQFRARPMTYKAVILMTPGENTLSVGIIDQSSNTSGFARANVVIP